MKYLNEEQKQLISSYVQHLVKEYELSGSFSNEKHCFELTDDFIGASKESVRDCHIGMEMFAEQIVHSLKFMPSKEEYEKMIKQDARSLSEC